MVTIDLQHILVGADKETKLKILKSGKLLSSNKTKNVKLFGHEEGSKFIFLQMDSKSFLPKGCPSPFYSAQKIELSSDLLLESDFYLKRGWSGDSLLNAFHFPGRELNERKKNKILKNFCNSVKSQLELELLESEFVSQEQIHRSEDSITPFSHEILIPDEIDLKFLISFPILKNKEKNIEKLLKMKYPNVSVVYY